MRAGLFSKLNAQRPGYDRPEEQAILEHLAVLLNTRQGSSALDPQYGMPDMTDVIHNVPAGLPALSRMIADAIQRYEPRLRSVAVRAIGLTPHALSLNFEVRAQIVRGGVLRFETKVSRGGQVRVG